MTDCVFGLEGRGAKISPHRFGAIAVFALAKTAKTWSSWLPASISQALSLSLLRTCNGIARFLNAGDTRINLGRNPDSKGAIGKCQPNNPADLRDHTGT
jgi:hypothetical protein